MSTQDTIIVVTFTFLIGAGMGYNVAKLIFG